VSSANPKTYISDKQFSEIFSIPLPTIRNWRHLGKGPAYSKFGRSIRYRLCDVEAFFEAHRVEPGAVCDRRPAE